MKFSVPTNFQNDLIPRLKHKEQIICVYGKLTEDFIGGGRPSLALPIISKRLLEKHVEEARKNGLEFNYLLNASCLGNREFTISGQRQLHSLLDWLSKINIGSVTVALPYLAQLIKKNYPNLKIHTSIFAHVDSIIKAQYWADLGADTIVLDSFSLNRDFETLKKIRQRIKCRLELIANNACLYQCPMRYYHRVVNAHASQKNNGAQKGYFIDYCIIHCRLARLENPVHFIRSDWIRPEDVGKYETIGIDSLKIVDRAENTDFILRVFFAYANRRYDGNLADLFAFTSQRPALGGAKKYAHYFRHLFKPLTVNIFKIKNVLQLAPLEVSIDNKALDGFLEHFKQGKCKHGLCDECGYCQNTADRVVRIDDGYRKKALAQYKAMSDELIYAKPFRF